MEEKLMSISSANNRNDYTGNGAVSSYDYTFRIFTQGDLLVTVKDTSNSESTLSIGTDYTVSGVGDQSGGSVALVSSGQAWLDGDGDLLTGYTITIRRDVDLVQETDIRNQGDFFPEVHEDAFDYGIMVDQQQQDEIDRSVKNPETLAASSFNPSLPTDINTADVTLKVNASGTGFEVGPTSAEIASASTSASDAAASATLSEEWASKSDGIVDTTDYSSKAYAIGGTGVTDTASRGASKEWATKTSGTVDTSEFSAKEYSQGSQAATGGSSKNWAQQTGADVTGASAGDMSSKEWAVGEEGRGVSGEGSSKDWSTYTTGTVDDTEYSAKEHAQGTQTRGASGGGSSKDWANYTGGTVDDSEFSAKKYATDAATSASEAATAAAASQWSDVAYVTNADSPVAISDSDAGKLYSVDTTGGAVVFNLAEISTLTLSNPWVIGVKKSVDSVNDITINRGGTDTIDGSNSVTVSRLNAGKSFIPDADGAPDDWTTLSFGEVPIDGAIVGDTDTQDLSNKTFTDGIILEELSSTPSNPSSGDKRFYAKNDDKLYTLDSSGNEIEVGAGGGAGGINYIENNDFETGVTDYSAYADTAGENAVDGTGGSPTLTFTHNTSTPLRGTGDGLVTKDAADRQGEGISIAFTVDEADKAKKIVISFDYSTSDNYADDDIRVQVYDVTNSNLIRVNGEDLKAGSGTHYAQFQTASDSDSYRLILHTSSTNALAYTINIDNVSVGPQKISYGSIQGPWSDEEVITITATSSNPSKGTVSTDRIKHYRIGSNAMIQMDYRHTTAGSAGTGDYLFELPSGLSFDDDVIQLYSTTEGRGSDMNMFNHFGSVQVHFDDGGSGSESFGIGKFVPYDSTKFRLYVQYNRGTAVDAAGMVGSTFYGLGAVEIALSGDFIVPIKGWGETSKSSEDFGGRKTHLFANDNAGGGITANVTNLTWTTTEIDSTASFDGTTYTVPETGEYIISGCVLATTAAINGIFAYKNGSADRVIGFEGGSSALTYFHTVYKLNKGDELTFRADSSFTLDATDPTKHFISIYKLGVSQQILDTETIACRYTTNSGQTVTDAGVVEYEDVDYDTHNAYDTSAGEYTAPATGLYSVKATCWTNSVSAGSSSSLFGLSISIDGASVADEREAAKTTSSIPHRGSVESTLNLIKGSVITVLCRENFSNTITLSSGTPQNYLEIKRIK